MSSSSSPASGGPQFSSFTVTSPADILSYIPHALGFLPDESLVVLTTTGRRLGATLRVDLPIGDTDPLAFAQGVLSFLEGDTEADGALLVVYTKEGWPRLEPPPRHRCVTTVDAVLEAAGMPVHAGWLVSASRWRDYFCTDEQCCPWPGELLDAVLSSALNAELVFGGSAFDASASEAVLRAAPTVGDGDVASGPGVQAVRDAQARYAARCAGRWDTRAQFQATSALWDAVILRPDAFDVDSDPGIAGFLLASIESRTIRDFLLVSACLGSSAALRGAADCGLLSRSGDPGAGPDVGPGIGPGSGPGAPEGCDPAARTAWVLPGTRCAGGLRTVPGVVAASIAAEPADTATTAESVARAAGGGVGVDYAAVLAGRFTGAITWDRVDGMTCVLGRLAAVSDGESRAAALTMSAWFDYARGRGSRAAVYLDAAERAVPGYRLARLLHELLRRGGLPAWARNRSTAWRSGARTAPPDTV